MRTPVVLIFIAISVLIAIGSRFYSLLFYWWMAIFRPQDWVWDDISYLRPSFVAGAILVGGCLVTGRFPRVKGAIGWMMVAFLALQAFAATTVGCGRVGEERLEFLITLWIVLFLTDRLIETPRQFAAVVFIIGVSLGFFASKAGLIAVLSGGASQYGVANLGGSFTDSNNFALGTAVIVFFMIASGRCASLLLDYLHRFRDGDEVVAYGRGVTTPKPVSVPPAKSAADGDAPPGAEEVREPTLNKVFRLGLYFAAACASFNVISLLSRGSMLALALGFLLFNAFQPNATKRFVALIPLMLVGLLLVPLPEDLDDRLASIFASEETRDKSAASRPFFWGVARDINRAYPTGIGPNCYKYHYDFFDSSRGRFGSYRSVHSSHFQVLAEVGYAGLAIWIALFYLSGRALWRVKRRSEALWMDEGERNFLSAQSTCLLCALVVFGIGSTFYEMAHIELIWVVFLLAGRLDRMSEDLPGSSGDVVPTSIYETPRKRVGATHSSADADVTAPRSGAVTNEMQAGRPKTKSVRRYGEP